MPEPPCCGEVSYLAAYEATYVEKLAQRTGSESQVESFNDRCEAVRSCYLGFYEVTTVEGLRQAILRLFADDQAAIVLATIHRAKGLEFDRVFILRPDKLPLTWPNQRPWEAEQEQNLRYVASTRAKQELYFVSSGANE